MDETFIDENDVAGLLGKSVFTLRNWRVKGYGPRYFKVGHAVRYRRSDILEWVEGRAVDPSLRGAA